MAMNPTNFECQISNVERTLSNCECRSSNAELIFAIRHWEFEIRHLPLAACLFGLFMAGGSTVSGQTTGVIGWGFNNNGQARPPSGLTNIVAVSASSGSSVALRADGT